MGAARGIVGSAGATAALKWNATAISTNATDGRSRMCKSCAGVERESQRANNLIRADISRWQCSWLATDLIDAARRDPAGQDENLR